jgi:hypothetical protein
MKKFFVAISAFVYIISSTGATMHMHYCMGKLADWGFGQNDSKTCSKCGMEKSSEKDNGCCRDEQKFVKNDTVQQTAEAGLLLTHLTSIAVPVSFIEIPLPRFSYATEENPLFHVPPRTGGVAVYIRNCVFLI